MPSPEPAASPAGPIVEVASVGDERVTPTLGKLDTFTISSGPDLLEYVEAELINSLFRMGFDVRQVDQGAPAADRKRVQVALLATELGAESTFLHPIAATVRLRAEVTDELGQSTFRREFRGAISRKLGMHEQGGPEDAKLLADVIDQAMATLVADKPFVAAVSLSAKEAQRRRRSQQKSRESTRDHGNRAPLPTEAVGATPSESSNRVADRLHKLDQLLEKGLIDRDDYARKRREILSDL